VHRRPLLPALFLLLAAATAGCHRRSATPEDCAAVLDRLVELELAESGYRDPALRTRWAREAHRRFARELEACPGLLVNNRLPACLAAARTSEAIVHVCFP
jgi:hypothetical protein